MNSIRKNYTSANGYSYYWDEEAQAPYLYNPARQSYITYDNERSAAAKARYVREKGLNGIMFWELRQDIPDKGLLGVLANK
jgi:chitinase